MQPRTKKMYFFGGAFFAGALFLVLMGQSLTSVSYAPTQTATGTPVATEEEQEPAEPEIVVTHIKTPDQVKALYMTNWVAGTPHLRERLVDLARETEVNALVIDIKDYSGKLGFQFEHPLVVKEEAAENRIPDVKRFIADLHDEGIYVIGRITVFQDPHYAQRHPDVAVQKESDKSVWKDYKGLSFVDVGAEDFWEYIVAISEESYALGFDELNFDYIRFPSDGNMRDVYYPISEKEITEDPRYGKAKAVERFFVYLEKELRDVGVVTSADLFGMTTTNFDDLNIGQVLERAEPYFDFLAPMVYPSHYPTGFNGWQNPNHYPYEVVHYAMARGADRLITASSSPDKLRPWLQDFDYGGNYGAIEVRAQIQATYDAGLNSWMLWDPANRYTREALLDKISN